jgi:hypothetical protein
MRRERPVEWAFSYSLMLLDRETIRWSFDALSDASIKQLPWVRIRCSPPARPLTFSTQSLVTSGAFGAFSLGYDCRVVLSDAHR